MRLSHVALWTSRNKRYKQPLAGEDDTEKELRTAIIGPTTSAFPLNEGWYVAGQPKLKESGQQRHLSDLIIHTITALLTDKLTKDVRPNCEAKWIAKWPRALDIDFDKLWASLGGKLTDPTEERAFRKVLHRAINANNRHPKAPTHACRLHCGEQNCRTAGVTPGTAERSGSGIGR